MIQPFHAIARVISVTAVVAAGLCIFEVAATAAPQGATAQADVPQTTQAYDRALELL